MKVLDQPLSDVAIMNVFNKGNFPGLNMIGVGMRDEILDKKVKQHINSKKDNAIIINLDTKDKGGSHWVAVYRRKGERKAHYFDSFGMAPFPEVDYFVRNVMSAKGGLKSLDIDLQEDKSSLCGYYATAWILSMYLHMPFRSIFQKDDFRGNIKKLKHLFSNL